MTGEPPTPAPDDPSGRRRLELFAELDHCYWLRKVLEEREERILSELRRLTATERFVS